MSGIISLVTALGSVMEEIPLEHALDFSQPLYVSRVSATLHLMVYQVRFTLAICWLQAER